MANYRLTLCYDGTRWKGWQKQGNTQQTIQGRLEGLLSRLRCTWFDAGAWVDDRAFTNLNTPEDYQQLLAHPRA